MRHPRGWATLGWRFNLTFIHGKPHDFECNPIDDMPNLALQLHATFLVFGVVHAIFSQADTHTHTFQSSFLCHWLENGPGRANSSYATCTIRATVDKQKIASPARFKFPALPVILQVSQQSVHRSPRFQSWSYQPRWSPFSIGAKGRTGGGITYKQGM